MKWREQKPTSTYILKLHRNSTGVPFFVTEASSCCHCHCRCCCSPLATATTTVAPWLHRRRLRRHCIVIGQNRLPPLFCDLFDCDVVVYSPLYCCAFLLLLHPFYHAVAAANACLRVVVIVIIIAVVTPAIPLPSPQSRVSTLPATQLSAPRGSSCRQRGVAVLALPRSRDSPRSDSLSDVVAPQSIIGGGAVPCRPSLLLSPPP